MIEETRHTSMETINMMAAAHDGNAELLRTLCEGKIEKAQAVAAKAQADANDLVTLVDEIEERRQRLEKKCQRLEEERDSLKTKLKEMAGAQPPPPPWPPRVKQPPASMPSGVSAP